MLVLRTLLASAGLGGGGGGRNARNDIALARWKRRLPVLSSGGGGGGGSSSTSSGGGGGSERLFSALGEDMKHAPGNWQTAAQLVAGTTVGAGILALPTVTESSGFVPSAVAIAGVWLYMVATGLLVAEVNLRTMCELGRGGVSLASMAQRSLGIWGIRVTSASYIFLHYAVLVAYISKGGETLNTAASAVLSLDAGNALWGILFAGGVSALCLYSSTATLNRLNALLIVAGLSAFGVLLSVAIPLVSPGQLFSPDAMHFENLASTAPVLALAFVYHNIIPIICTDLEGDRNAIRLALVTGTGGPCVMYLIWNAVVLGFPAAAGGGMLSDPVARLIASSSQSGGIVSAAAASFSLAAVTTSFIGFVLGLSDFFADWMRMPSDQGKNLTTISMSVIPPIVLACSAPGVFIGALDFAGTFGVLTLFGVIPAAMAYSIRYSGGAAGEEGDRGRSVEAKYLWDRGASDRASSLALMEEDKGLAAAAEAAELGSSGNAGDTGNAMVMMIKKKNDNSSNSTSISSSMNANPGSNAMVTAMMMNDKAAHLLPGGKIGLVCAGGFAGWIIAQDIVDKVAGLVQHH